MSFQSSEVNLKGVHFVLSKPNITDYKSGVKKQWHEGNKEQYRIINALVIPQ